MKTRLGNLAEQVKSVQPIAEQNGRKLYSIDDAKLVGHVKQTEEQVYGKTDVGDREYDPARGTYRSSHTPNLAINPEVYFINRFRTVEDEEGDLSLEVVTDYRAIKEQGSGQVYTDNVRVFVIDRDDKDKLQVVGIRLINADEFVREFKKELDHPSMTQILTAVKKSQTKVTEKESLKDIV